MSGPVSKNNNNKSVNRKINNIYKQSSIKGTSINNYWTLREDEILSKSIEKYGTNKWNKIATLLMKKSAIQCKLRWEEYLLPKLHNNIQTTFNSDEDKQLLRMYSIYRDQWKTIAEIMAKTATSCMKRYNELLTMNDGNLEQLDESENKDNKTLNMTIAESLQPKEFTSTETQRETESEQISHDAQQRLVANLDKKKIKKAKAEREFSEMINENIQKRRDMLKIGMRNYRLRLPNQITKFKRLEELTNDEGLVGPPPGSFDTTEELKNNRELLRKFEHLISKRNVFHANKELGFEYLYKRRDLVNESHKDKPVLQIGKVRNFKVKKETKTTEHFTQDSFLKKINFVKPQLPNSIMNDSRSSVKVNKIEKCGDKQLVNDVQGMLDRLPEPLNDFEIAGEEDDREEEEEAEKEEEEEAEKEEQEAQKEVELNQDEKEVEAHVAGPETEEHQPPAAVKTEDSHGSALASQ